MNEQALIAPTGNTFIDTLSQVSGIVTNTASQVLQTGGTFLDQLTAWKIARSQNVANPVYVPAPVSNQTDASKLNNILLIGSAVIGVGLVIWAVKK